MTIIEKEIIKRTKQIKKRLKPDRFEDKEHLELSAKLIAIIELALPIKKLV